MKNWTKHLYACFFTGLLLGGVTPIFGQSDCYVQLDDASGYDISPYQADIDAKACELVAAFPDSTYADSFKVYGFGFYLINENFEGGFQDVWEKTITNVSTQSTYYLIFGRQLADSHGKSRVWVDFNLPSFELFDCIDEDDVDHIKIQVQGIGDSNPDPFEFSQIEIQVMEFLKQKISCSEICDNGIDDDKDGWIDCNDPDCAEERSPCSGQAVFREYLNQKFGFDANKIESYPTYSTPLGDGVPWKSLGIGIDDQVNVEFSDQLILGDLTYQATGVEIIGSLVPQDYSETITIKGTTLTENAKIEVLDIDDNVIGGLMIKVLPAKSMILNLILVKLPSESNYPNVNFTESELEDVLNNCFKQINMSWSVNIIDQYEVDFDANESNSLDGFEDFEILHTFLRLDHTNLYINRYYPASNPSLFNSTTTYILYDNIEGSSNAQSNGWLRLGQIYGAINSVFQYNKRTVAHENGHRIGFIAASAP